MARDRLIRYAGLSVAAAVLTIALKGAAYALTGSVGLLSDALESLVNLASALMAMAMLAVAARPADDGHNYGHDKAEYFSSALEGAAILAAALLIAWAALPRLLNPQPIEQVWIGLAISGTASLINLAVSRVLMRAGRAHESVTLQADAHHLMTDVWTSVGIVAGVVLVQLSGWLWLDPLIALAVAAHIAWTGLRILGNAFDGLMDAALPGPELAAVRELLDGYKREHDVDWHALRTRVAGSRRFVSVHLLVPGAWSVQRAHDLAERIEAELGQRLRRLHVITHLEPIEDAVSWRDTGLEREDSPT